MLNADKLAEMLTDRYGVPLIGSAFDDADGQHAQFRPDSIPHTQGFKVVVGIGWKTVEAEFTPATYARPLLSVMATANAENRCLFRTFVRSAINAGAKVIFRVSGGNVDPLQTEAWPSDWESLLLCFSKGPLEIDAKNPEAIEALALDWSSRMLGSVLSLIPLEPVQESPAGEAEGGAYQALITKYERSAINRAACVSLNGTLCKVCGFDFERFYGAVGFGYIEVHHVESVASLAPGTILDPGKDLVPLCSNCHSMAHKRRPLPYSVDELKSMVAAASAKS